MNTPSDQDKIRSLIQDIENTADPDNAAEVAEAEAMLSQLRTELAAEQVADAEAARIQQEKIDLPLRLAREKQEKGAAKLRDAEAKVAAAKAKAEAERLDTIRTAAEASEGALTLWDRAEAALTELDRDFSVPLIAEFTARNVLGVTIPADLWVTLDPTVVRCEFLGLQLQCNADNLRPGGGVPFEASLFLIHPFHHGLVALSSVAQLEHVRREYPTLHLGA